MRYSNCVLFSYYIEKKKSKYKVHNDNLAMQCYNVVKRLKTKKSYKNVISAYILSQTILN